MPTIIIHRNADSLGAFSAINPYLDEQFLGKVSKGQEVSFEIKPGAYQIQARMAGGYASEPFHFDMGESELFQLEVQVSEYGKWLFPVQLMFLAVIGGGGVIKGLYYSIFQLMFCLAGLVYILRLFSQKKQFLVFSPI